MTVQPIVEQFAEKETQNDGGGNDEADFRIARGRGDELLLIGWFGGVRHRCADCIRSRRVDRLVPRKTGCPSPVVRSQFSVLESQRPADHVTSLMKRSGKIPMYTVASALTPRATRRARLMGRRLLSVASRMNMALAMRR